jgi:hypothetical protein
MVPPKRFVAASLFVALGSPTLALADAPTRKVWLEARPWTCAGEVPSLATDVELACDAMRASCAVARREEDATERATLYCGDGGTWRLGLGATDGPDSVIVTLDGDRDERLRSAGMWVARVKPHGGPPSPEVAIAAPAPPPTTVAPPPPAPPPAVEEAVPAVLVPVPSDPVDVVTPEKPRSRIPGRGGFSLSLFDGVANSAVAGVLGGRLSAAFPIAHGFFVAPAASFATLYDNGWPIAGPGNANVLGREVLAGADIGWGAPFDDLPVGFSLGLGAGGSWGDPEGAGAVAAAYSPSYGPVITSNPNPAAGVWFTGYGRASVVLQLPFRSWPVRPTVALSFAQTFGELGQPAEQAMLETGLAWQAF